MGEYNTTYIPSCSLQYGLFGHTFFEGKPSAKKPSQPHCIIEEATAAMSHKVHLAYLCNSISQDLQFLFFELFFRSHFVTTLPTYLLLLGLVLLERNIISRILYWGQKDIFNKWFCKSHQSSYKENNIKISYWWVLKSEVSCNFRVEKKYSLIKLF